MLPVGPHMRIYTRLDFGNLARFYMLDDRQYRYAAGLPATGTRGGSNTVDVAECPELADPEAHACSARAQEHWLEAGLGASRARWNVLAQQTLMAQFDRKPGPGRSRLDRRLGRLSGGAAAPARPLRLRQGRRTRS